MADEKDTDEVCRGQLAVMLSEALRALPELNHAQLRLMADGLRSLYEATARVRT